MINTLSIVKHYYSKKTANKLQRSYSGSIKKCSRDKGQGGTEQMEHIENKQQGDKFKTASIITLNVNGLIDSTVYQNIGVVSYHFILCTWALARLGEHVE